LLWIHLYLNPLLVFDSAAKVSLTIMYVLVNVLVPTLGSSLIKVQFIILFAIITNNSFLNRNITNLECDYSNNFELNLKTKLMKNSIISITVVFFSMFVNAQNKSPRIDNNLGDENYVESISFKIGIGTLIPQDAVKKYFDISPMLDFSFNFPLKSNKSIDLTLQFAIPNQVDKFAYIRTIDTIQAKSAFMVNAFLKFKKDILKTNTTRFKIGLGVGMSSITTDARNPFYAGKDDEDKYETITAFLVSPGIELVKTFSNNDEITIGLSLQYSPYKIEGALQENIGGLFYVPKIAYRF